MSFIRPEVRAAFWTWREVLAGIALALTGLWWLAGPGGLLGWVGAVLILAGLALARLGWQRMRFRAGGDGPGVVEIDEGRIRYLGPLTGGVADLSDIDRLILDPTGHPLHWVFEGSGDGVLRIPVNAAGAEALFDAFAALPGLDTARLLGHVSAPPPGPVVLWTRPGAPARPLPLSDLRRLH